MIGSQYPFILMFRLNLMLFIVGGNPPTPSRKKALKKIVCWTAQNTSKRTCLLCTDVDAYHFIHNPIHCCCQIPLPFIDTPVTCFSTPSLVSVTRQVITQGLHSQLFFLSSFRLLHTCLPLKLYCIRSWNSWNSRAYSGIRDNLQSSWFCHSHFFSFC